MEGLLVSVSKVSVLVIDAMALLVVVVGTVEAFVMVFRAMLTSNETSVDRREIWLRYARWLIAGLTFQLAADIVETSVTPSWESIGRLGAIAVIRTFLNFFLDRDLNEIRERQKESLRRTERAA